MKALRSLTTVVGIAVCICGCATTGTEGVVQIGPDTYMIGELGRFTDFSGSAVKTRFYQQAARESKILSRPMIEYWEARRPV